MRRNKTLISFNLRPVALPSSSALRIPTKSCSGVHRKVFASEFAMDKKNVPRASPNPRMYNCPISLTFDRVHSASTPIPSLSLSLKKLTTNAIQFHYFSRAGPRGIENRGGTYLPLILERTYILVIPTSQVLCTSIDFLPSLSLL